MLRAGNVDVHGNERTYQGIWTDSQIPPLKRIVDFCHGQGTKIGVQLAHAGRKASTLAYWVQFDYGRTRASHRAVAYEDENGWPDNGKNR